MIGTKELLAENVERSFYPSCTTCVGELIRGDESTLICLDCGDVFKMDEEGNIIPDYVYDV